MDDYNANVLTEAKNEYSANLVNILSPLLIQGLKSIFNEACKLCADNDEHDKYLMTFQNFLTRVPKWNQKIIETETKRIISESRCNYLEDLLTCVHITQLKVLTSIRVATKQKKINIDIPKLNDFIHNVYIKCARKFYSLVYLFENNIQPLERQKNMRECETICRECILNAIRESMPIEKILRAYMDETTEEEIVEEITEEEVPVDMSSNEVEEKINEEVKEEIKKATDAIKEQINVVKEEKKSVLSEKASNKESSQETSQETETSNVKLEIEETIKDMENIIENKVNQKVAQEIKKVEKGPSLENQSITINTTPSLKNKPEESNEKNDSATLIKFNDVDNVLNYDKTSSLRDKSTNFTEKVSAPKTIDRLEEISAMRNEQRKLEEDEYDDDDDFDDSLKIFDDGPSLKLDALDVQVLDDSLELKKQPLLTDVETL